MAVETPNTELERIAAVLETINKNFQLVVDSMVPTAEETANRKTYDNLYLNNNIKEQELRSKELKIREASLLRQEKDLGV